MRKQDSSRGKKGGMRCCGGEKRWLCMQHITEKAARAGVMEASDNDDDDDDGNCFVLVHRKNA
jgi:hypothetical protein